MADIKIPKIIHYCWLSNDPVPEQIQKYMQTWKKYLADYEFKLWNFEIFDKNSSLWVKQAFEAKKYAFAADYIRLYAVYTCGGIYMDMDVEVLKPFDDLLNNELMFAYDNNETKDLEAGCFGAKKGHPFIGQCLEYYNNRHFIKEDGSLDTLPLPCIITPIYNNTVKTEPFPPDYFTAKAWATGELRVTKNTYTIHHFAASWVDSGIVLIRKDKLDRWGFELMPQEKEIYYNLLQNKFFVKNKQELKTAVNLMDRIFAIGIKYNKDDNLQILIKSLLKQIAENGIQNKVTSLKLYCTIFRKWKIFETPRANLRYIYHCMKNIGKHK